MIGQAGLIAAVAAVLKLFDDPSGGDLPVSQRVARAESFLVLRYENALGSAINATVLFAALRALKPRAYIAVACNRFCAGVLRGNPFIDEFIVTADPRTDFLGAAREARRGVRRGRGKFDCLITSCDDRPRMAAMALLLERGLRIGHGPDNAFHLAFHEDGGLSVIAEHLRVAGAVGEVAAVPTPRVYYSPADAQAVRDSLAIGGCDAAQPLVILTCRGSGGQPTDWYDDRFASVADRLAARYGAGIVFTGTAGQASAIDGIRAAMRSPSINLAGRITIAGLSALVAMSDLMVTLDTGAMHLARGWGTPMVVIASAWQPAHLWLTPLIGERVAILRRDVTACAGCAKFTCATRACLDEITVDDVVGAAARLLERFPPGGSQPISPNGRHSPGVPAAVQIHPT